MNNKTLISFVEKLAGKDKLKIDFNIYDYVKWAGLQDVETLEQSIHFEINQMMRRYWFYAEKLYPYEIPLNFKYCSINIISEIYIEDEKVKITFTKESLKLRSNDNWITRIVTGRGLENFLAAIDVYEEYEGEY